LPAARSGNGRAVERDDTIRKQTATSGDCVTGILNQIAQP
jgi:hypothetical protein